MGNYIQSIIILFDLLGKVIVIIINCNHHHYKDVQLDRPFADDFDVDHSDHYKDVQLDWLFGFNPSCRPGNASSPDCTQPSVIIMLIIIMMLIMIMIMTD